MPCCKTQPPKKGKGKGKGKGKKGKGETPQGTGKSVEEVNCLRIDIVYSLSRFYRAMH